MDMNAAMNNLVAAIEAMDPELLAGGIVFWASVFAAIVIFSVVRYLLTAIGYSKMYRKAGVAGWKAFIPVYNTYNNYKISWAGKFFFLSAALYIVLNAVSGSDALVMQLLTIASGIALIVVVVKQHLKMAKLFGKGAGTAIALIFFPGITAMILGLGKAEFNAIAE